MDNKNTSESASQLSVPTEDFTIPEWHIKLVKKELDSIANGDVELMPWSEALESFKY